MSLILLISLDNSQREEVRKYVRGGIETSREHSIEVFDLKDVKHKYSDEPAYSLKLKHMLDEVKFVFIVTSSVVTKVKDIGQFVDLLKDVDADTRKIFHTFVSTEKDRRDSKLAFLSLRDALGLPAIFGNLRHISNMIATEGGTAKVNVAKVTEIATMCSKIVDVRATFPAEEKKKKKGKKFGLF